MCKLIVLYKTHRDDLVSQKCVYKKEETKAMEQCRLFFVATAYE